MPRPQIIPASLTDTRGKTITFPFPNPTADPKGPIITDYVGNTEMAKHYGRLRMFLLRRAGDGQGPAVLGDIERAEGKATRETPL